jgi:hypothetical protein
MFFKFFKKTKSMEGRKLTHLRVMMDDSLREKVVSARMFSKKSNGFAVFIGNNETKQTKIVTKRYYQDKLGFKKKEKYKVLEEIYSTNL